VSIREGDRYLTLAEVARRTGRHPEQLRQWCATGRLACERIGRDWLLLESRLEQVDQLASRRRRAPITKRMVIGASFTDPAVGRRALAEATSRFQLNSRDAALAPLAIDDVAFVLVAVVVAESQFDEAVALFEAAGGKIVADVPEGDEGGEGGEGGQAGRVPDRTPDPAAD
jgi:hypothetical protein